MENNKVLVNNITKNNKITVNANKKSTYSFKQFMHKILGDKNNMPNKENQSSNRLMVTKFIKNKQVKVLIIVLIFSICALFILNSSFGENVTNTASKKSDSVFQTSLQYCAELEDKLEAVLNKISGAGCVSVMITVESAPELIIATSSSEKTNTSSSGSTSQTNTTVSKEPIIVTNGGVSGPLVVTEKLPQITGVVVVAEGAKNTNVKLTLLQAVQALLNVKSDNIQIYY